MTVEAAYVVDQFPDEQEVHDAAHREKTWRDAPRLEDLPARIGGTLTERDGAPVRIGGEDVSARSASADLAFCFPALPRVPVMLLFWEGDPEAGFAAEVKRAFDETITAHLDIESILFLSEHLARRLIDEAP